jgi:putative spermidine/putrescine transport system substrate-binding protein
MRKTAAVLTLLLLAACTREAPVTPVAPVAPVTPPAGGTVIQYDCIPNYANWGGVTAKYKQVSGVTVPPDSKGSSVAKAALAKEKDAPQADCAYYSGAIGFAAAKEGLHAPYKPAGFDKIPDGLKDPEGLWFTVHTAAIAFVVNTKALGETKAPRSWADLLKPEYKGKVAYDDPTWGGTSYTMLYGLNRLMGGTDTNFTPGLDYLKKLDANCLKYPRESVYNDVLRGEIAVWINADGQGYKMKFVDKGPVEVVIPEEGSTAMPLVMGLVKGAPHEAEAKKYLDWLLTPEAQGLMAESYFRPVSAPLPANLAANFLSDADYARVKVYDLGAMAGASEALKKAWLEAIGQR